MQETLEDSSVCHSEKYLLYKFLRQKIYEKGGLFFVLLHLFFCITTVYWNNEYHVCGSTEIQFDNE